MIQNIKVDIVYYMTAADFEFEFNLGSCCHMRLLNDKAKDKKSFINSLARAVSRSRIIICVGPIFGEDGLITTTAAAISRPLKAVDNNAYGIASEGEIKIIDGAVPLVTKEGYFGGCIIESGSQTIILLTENRTIRKSIMKNLIHPYIEDTSLMQSAGSAQPFGVDDIARTISQTEAAKAESAEELPAEGGEAAEAAVLPIDSLSETEETETTPPAEEILPDNGGSDDGDYTDSQEIISEYEPSAGENDGDYEAAEEPQDEETEDIEDEAEEYPAGANKGKGISVSILIITLVLLLAVVALCYFVVFLPLQKGISINDYIGQLFSSASSTTSV